jgi:hypothetical protein
MLTVTGRASELTRLWADALEHVIVRHPNRAITLLWLLDDATEPNLHWELDANPSSDSDETIAPFRITNVRLTFFPGVRAARAWVAAAWSSFLQHEALELVTVGDLKTRVLDPHENRARLDYVFHTGLPFKLTPETLLAALALAIPIDDARALVAQSMKEP